MANTWLAAAAQGSNSDGWHYAAWVSFDLRLFLLVVLIALLTAGGLCALLVRGRKLVEFVAAFIVSFTLTFLIVLVIFNEIAHYPVFVVESMFPFP